MLYGARGGVDESFSVSNLGHLGRRFKALLERTTMALGETRHTTQPLGYPRIRRVVGICLRGSRALPLVML